MANLVIVRTSKLAVASLLFGLVPIGHVCVLLLLRLGIQIPYVVWPLSILLGMVAPLVSIFLGSVARQEIVEKSSEIGGLQIAKIGLVLGYAGLVFWVYVAFMPPTPPPLDESGAIHSLKSIYLGFENCRKGSADRQMPDTLQQLQKMANDPGLINDPVAAGGYAGYTYTYHLRSPHNDGKLDSFEAVAVPSVIFVNPRHARSFYIDETGVIRVESNKRPTGTSPLLVDHPYNSFMEWFGTSPPLKDHP